MVDWWIVAFQLMGLRTWNSGPSGSGETLCLTLIVDCRSGWLTEGKRRKRRRKWIWRQWWPPAASSRSSRSWSPVHPKGCMGWVYDHRLRHEECSASYGAGREWRADPRGLKLPLTLSWLLQDDVGHESSVLWALWEQDPEESDSDCQWRHYLAYAFLLKRQGAEPLKPPVLAAHSQSG